MEAFTYSKWLLLKPTIRRAYIEAELEDPTGALMNIEPSLRVVYPDKVTDHMGVQKRYESSFDAGNPRDIWWHELPEQLRKKINIAEEKFNVCPIEAKLAMIGSIPPRERAELGYVASGDQTFGLYRRYQDRYISGTMEVRYTLKDDCVERNISLEDFMEAVKRAILREESEETRTITNVTLLYVTSNNKTKWLSFLAQDLTRMSIRECLDQVMEKEKGEEHDLYRNYDNQEFCESYKSLHVSVRSFGVTTIPARFVNGINPAFDQVVVDPAAKGYIMPCATGAKKVHYSFDFETVYDLDTGLMKPYAVAISSEDGKTVSLVSHRHSSIEHFVVDFLTTNRPKKGETKYIWGFNNARFDNYLLLDLCRSYNLTFRPPFITKSGILVMQVCGYIVLDLHKFVSTSLAKACSDYKIDMPKESLSHHNVQMAYMLGNLDKYIVANKDIISHYVERDASCVLALLAKVRQTFKETTAEDIENHATLGQLSYRAFVKTLPEGVRTRMPVYRKAEDEFIRSSIIGGRCQVFHPRSIVDDTEIALVDIVSLYPHVMCSNIFPLGDPVPTDVYVDEKIGIYNIYILKQPRVKILPYRREDGSLDWEYDSPFFARVLSPSVELLRKYDVPHIVYDGYYWKDSIDVFSGYLKPIFEEKKAQDVLKESSNKEYNPTKRNVCKLLMNALSGKLAQKVYEDITIMVDNKRDMDRARATVDMRNVDITSYGSITFVKGKKKALRPTMPSVWSSLIYDYARTYMYESLYSKVPARDMYVTDTDSLCLTYKAYERLQTDYPQLFGSNIGQAVETVYHYTKSLANGVKGPYLIAVDKKCYHIYCETGAGETPLKTVFKGVNTSKEEALRDKVIKDARTIERFPSLPSIALHNIYYYRYMDYGSGPVSSETYRSLCRGEKVYIMCSTMRRELHPGEGVMSGIRHAFLIKEF